jgi:hypothetical protein
MAKLIQVIESVENKGLGIPENPIRNVTNYFSLDGELLASEDPFIPFNEMVDAISFMNEVQGIIIDNFEDNAQSDRKSRVGVSAIVNKWIEYKKRQELK